MFKLNPRWVTVCAVLVLQAVSMSTAYAQELLQDSDYDGIVDSAEVSTYQTDPLVADTDGDGYQDLVELEHGSDPTTASITPESVLAKDVNNLVARDDPWWWLAARIFGITGFILLTGVVIMGLTQTSKVLIKVRLMGIPMALRVHRVLALLTLTSLGAHVAGLVFDSYIKLTLVEALVPFRLTREVNSALGFDLRLPVGLGIVAGYLMVVLIFTSEQRGKVIPVRLWRALHYLTFLAYGLLLVHGILSGTDTAQPWMLAIYITSGVAVACFVVLRLFKAKLVRAARPSLGVTQVLNKRVN
jgi:sulfoxide reductase heme-binding subunit YedZ